MNGSSVMETHSGKGRKPGSRNLMGWTGKIIGAAVGLLAGPVGAAVGLLLGHQYDLAESRSRGAGGEADADPARISGALFETTFAVMGYLAKADGRVSEAEIDAARSIMRQMRLDQAHVHRAIEAFNRGKAVGYPLQSELEQLRRLCAWRPDLLRFFMEIQLRAGLLGNDLSGPVRGLLWGIGERLGFGRIDLDALESILRGEGGFGGHAYGAGAGARSGAVPPHGARLAMAYETLGVTASASDAEVKKAYRRLMSENHPDKLVARGLPESMQELAKEKTQRIRQAYDLVVEHRGLR